MPQRKALAKTSKICAFCAKIFVSLVFKLEINSLKTPVQRINQR
jgi:hypothetical protein